MWNQNTSFITPLELVKVPNNNKKIIKNGKTNIKFNISYDKNTQPNEQNFTNELNKFNKTFDRKF